MASKTQSRNAQRLLTVCEVVHAKDGDHPDRGGLYLRVWGESASWVFRFTSPCRKRRETGFGKALRADSDAAGKSLTTSRGHADDARHLLATGIDPIDARSTAETLQKKVAAALL